MKHIKTINKANLKASAEKGGCGKCQRALSAFQGTHYRTIEQA